MDTSWFKSRFRTINHRSLIICCCSWQQGSLHHGADPTVSLKICIVEKKKEKKSHVPKIYKGFWLSVKCLPPSTSECPWNKEFNSVLRFQYASIHPDDIDVDEWGWRITQQSYQLRWISCSEKVLNLCDIHLSLYTT